MTAEGAALIELMQSYLGGMMDPFITQLEVQKLMYFMQESGEALRLQYKKALYGPYAENLRHLLMHIDGYYITGYANMGDNPSRQLQLVPGIIEESQSFLESFPETR